MPLDATDYEKISAMMERIQNRMESLTQNFISRKDADDRFNGIIERIVKIEANQSKTTDYILVENKEMRKLVQDKFDQTMTGINEIKESIAQRQDTNARYVVSVIVSFILGGGLLTLLQFLHAFGK